MTAVAYALSRLPGFGLMGALGLALLLGLFWRALFGLPDTAVAGSRFSARTLLRIGVVLLGVRLDFALLYGAGPVVLGLDLLVIVFGLVVMERLGKWMSLPRGLRLTVAVGSAVCGASAIAAAAPVVGADSDEVSVSVGIISVLGTVGVVFYALLAPLLNMSVERYGLMTGSTLHEVAQVLAAGAAQGAEALDLATLTKLTRVALLAPVLLIIGSVLSRRDGASTTAHTSGIAAKTPLLPAFLVGFLTVGVVNSLGFIPPALAGVMATASLVLTAASMAGIGLGVDFGVLRRIGGGPAVLAVVGFGLIVGVATLYTAVFT